MFAHSSLSRCNLAHRSGFQACSVPLGAPRPSVRDQHGGLGLRSCGTSPRSSGRAGQAACHLVVARRGYATSLCALSNAKAGQDAKPEVFTLSVELPTRDMQMACNLQCMPIGKGKQAIIVADVDPDSTAFEAGVRAGMKVFAIQDGNRPQVSWPMSDAPSMRFVRDVFKMRVRGTILLDFQECLTEQQLIAVLNEQTGAPSPDDGVPPSAASGSAASSESAAPSAPAASGWAMLGDAASQNGGEATETIADRMQRRESLEERGAPGRPSLAERQARRQEVMDIDEKRNDTGLLISVTIGLFGPAAIGLAIAYFSGYLDKLADLY